MMAQDQAESTREPINYGRFINHFLPDIIKLIHELQRINKKICRQKNVCIVYQISINEKMLPKYTRTCTQAHTHTHLFLGYKNVIGKEI